MVEQGVTAAAMEVSSHALALGRVAGTSLRRRRLHQPVPGPPGLPPRHRRLLRGQGGACSRPRYARAGVVNIDDARGRQLAARPADPDHHVLRGRRARRRLARRRRPRRRRREHLPGRSGPAASRPTRRSRCPGRSTSPTRWPRSWRWSRRASGWPPRWPGSPPARACPAAWSGSTPARTSPCSSTTRTSPARCEAVLTALRPVTAGSLAIVLGCGGDRDTRQAPADGRGRRRGWPMWRFSPVITRARRIRSRYWPRCWPAPWRFRQRSGRT